MADKTYAQLTSATEAADTDLLAIYPSGGPLKKYTFSAFLTQVLAGLGSTLLTVANNLSDLGSPSSARANLGLGTAATLASGALFQVSNNLSEVANAGTARTNIGAAAAASPTITGGVTFSGSTKQNVQALAALDVDLSASDFFTKAISADSTITFSNPTSAKAQGFILELTTSSSAEPTWPDEVEWSLGSEPTLGDGRHVLGFITFDGGSTWTGMVGALAAAAPS